MLSTPHIPLEHDQFIISFTFGLRRVLFRIKCKRAPHERGLALPVPEVIREHKRD
jgi:hypothetical protein